jgi:hypothetical protein
MRSFRFLTVLLFFVPLVSAAGQIVRVEQNEYWIPFERYQIEIDRSDSEIRELVARWDQIGNELNREGSVGGTYEEYGYRGYFLRWAPGGGFIYVYHSEHLSIIDFSYGKVSVQGGVVTFLPEREMRKTFREVKLATPTKWITARFAGGSYLVPGDRLQEFGNYVAGRAEYNDFNGPCCDYDPFFFSTEHSLKGSTAKPVLVDREYQQFIKRPINAEITFMGQKRRVTDYGLHGRHFYRLFEKAALIPIKVNAGRDQGLERNTLLRLVTDSGPQYIRILKVRNNSASGVIIRGIGDDGVESYYTSDSPTDEPVRKLFPQVRVGARLTTSPISDQ